MSASALVSDLIWYLRAPAPGTDDGVDYVTSWQHRVARDCPI